MGTLMWGLGVREALYSYRGPNPDNRNYLKSPGKRLLRLWQTLSPLPGGQWLFAQLFSLMVPYSGSVGPRVRVLTPGHAEIEIPDRRSNRQHLGSVHAVALVNV
ncbi:MAG TPA: DUF4442 domain-containing protein, partial [Steroidobacteraceae bacterium]|nr:DUF4442 domain-containing protein [Steroidobacteraceae bacterium]